MAGFLDWISPKGLSHAQKTRVRLMVDMPNRRPPESPALDPAVPDAQRRPTVGGRGMPRFICVGYWGAASASAFRRWRRALVVGAGEVDAIRSSDDDRRIPIPCWRFRGATGAPRGGAASAIRSGRRPPRVGDYSHVDDTRCHLVCGRWRRREWHRARPARQSGGRRKKAP